jgi:hypothetical protein
VSKNYTVVVVSHTVRSIFPTLELLSDDAQERL